MAIRKMPKTEFQAILLVGIYTIPLRYAAKQMGVTKDVMWRRYNAGLEWIANYLNTGGQRYKQ